MNEPITIYQDPDSRGMIVEYVPDTGTRTRLHVPVTRNQMLQLLDRLARRAYHDPFSAVLAPDSEL